MPGCHRFLLQLFGFWRNSRAQAATRRTWEPFNSVGTGREPGSTSIALVLRSQAMAISSTTPGFMEKDFIEAKRCGKLVKGERDCHMTFVTSKIAWRESRKMAHDKTQSIEYDRLIPRSARRSLYQPKNVFCGQLAPAWQVRSS